MAYKEKDVSLFKYGIIDELNSETIPAGSASEADNFLSLGDRIELVRGQKQLGDDAAATVNKVDGLGAGTDVDGTDYIYKYVGGKIQRYDSVSDTWGDVVDYGVNAVEDFTFAKNRTPAGAFIWGSSPNTGLVRINLANPDSYADFYGVTTDVHRGYLKAATNSLYMWQVNEFGSVFWRSHYGDDYPYTQVTGESYGTGSPPQKTFAHTAAHTHIVGRSISITDTVETFTDDGNGILTGDAGGTGTVNYTTGACSVTFAVAPAGAITMGYYYEVPYTNGLADFSYTSPTRAAREAFFLAQYDDNSEIQNMYILDGDIYVAHQQSWWKVTIEPDDSDATNILFRENTGIPSIRSAVATGEGIYYIDDTDSSEKKVRLLRFDRNGQRVKPVVISDTLDLNAYDFSDCAATDFGEYILWACRSNSVVTYNDIILAYNTRLETWDRFDANVRCFTVYNDKLYGGSSVNGNVYELFSGFDSDGSVVRGSWTSNDWDLDSDEIKKIKRFVVEGDIQNSQELIVEVSYDHGVFDEVGRIDGNGDYVDKSAVTAYGSVVYGSGTYGSGDAVDAYRYMREFKINSDKFQKMRVRFRTESFGYLNVREYIVRDIRDCGRRIPKKFR